MAIRPTSSVLSANEPLGLIQLSRLALFSNPMTLHHKLQNSAQFQPPTSHRIPRVSHLPLSTFDRFQLLCRAGAIPCSFRTGRAHYAISLALSTLAGSLPTANGNGNWSTYIIMAPTFHQPTFHLSSSPGSNSPTACIIVTFATHVDRSLAASTATPSPYTYSTTAPFLSHQPPAINSRSPTSTASTWHYFTTANPAPTTADTLTPPSTTSSIANPTPANIATHFYHSINCTSCPTTTTNGTHSLGPRSRSLATLLTLSTSRASRDTATPSNITSTVCSRSDQPFTAASSYIQ